MYKCPRCKDQSVVEDAIAYLEWKRMCLSCGFVFTIKGHPCDEVLPDELLDAARFEKQLALI
jgi:hypothetical protein